MVQPELACGKDGSATPALSISSASEFLSEFDAYLGAAKGLAEGTRRKYGRFVQGFLDGWCGDSPPNWQDLSIEDLRAYLRHELSSKRRRPSNSPIVALRAMLRFLAVRGLVLPGLEETLPRIRRWRHATLPASLSIGDVDRLIKCAADAATFQPLRNAAIMLLLARTGMRAAEVVHLSLDDVDWAGGIIHIRGTKSRRDRDLPLFRDVGRALLAYIKRERPSSSYRTVFLQAVTSARPFSDSSAISKIVRRALNRADIAPARGAAHLLRHAAATNMLTRGTSFKNIADVLGHQSLQSTALYAKLDLPSLSRVAMPWPGDRS
ncbi:tyrosine-type recombinase/integrase [Cupriavidus taiwanensis]|uniref:Site-specific recombinase XerD n=1 Tax=Cupriavidus taiwanensis TaxID=164546 RepID=A0A375JD87_9BURK|nr:tyrosine-type recombinase/integrase [Cupriavidus taiwanensis]SPS02899.1 Site-specific recombinase XerD [Cupriavidus taiwanensis]